MNVVEYRLHSEQKKPLNSQRLFTNYITIVGAQEGTRTPTKLLAST